MQEQKTEKSLLSRAKDMAAKLIDAVVAIDDSDEEIAFKEVSAQREPLGAPTERSLTLCNTLGLDPSRAVVIELIFNDWESQIPRNGVNYFKSVAPALSKICVSDEDWLEAGEYLCDKTAPIFKRGNGSHQFLCELVPELIDKEVVNSIFELRRWVEVVVDRVESLNGRNGSDHYNHLRRAVAQGEIKNLSDLDEWSPAA